LVQGPFRWASDLFGHRSQALGPDAQHQHFSMRMIHVDGHISAEQQIQYQPVPTFDEQQLAGQMESQMQQAPMLMPVQMPEQPTCRERWASGHFTITPENNAILDAWDLVVISALFVTALALPFEVSIVVEPAVKYLQFSRIIDLIFTVDIVLTFNVAIVVEEKGAANVEVFERRPAKISGQYMAFPFSDNAKAGWFWPDLLTVMPWDVIAKMGVLGIDASNMKLIRVLRLLRMLRLVRVVKLFKRWHIRSGMKNSVIKIITCAAITLLLVHWLACIWGHLGMNAMNGEGTTWLKNHLTLSKDGSSRVTEMTCFEVYKVSLYLCVVVLTSVGFGDITPTNQEEAVAMIVTLFFTGVTWAWVVATVVAVITNIDVFGTVFNQVMDDLNEIMTVHDVGNSLRIRVRQHVHESYKIQRHMHHHESIKWLSQGLQGELAMQSGVGHVLSKVWYLREIPEEIVIELADEFKGMLYSPGEVIMDLSSLAVILRGTCVRKGIMLSRDAVFGEDMILACDKLRDPSCPRTLTFLEVMRLSREALCMAAAKYPNLDQQLRRAQIKLALWRGFIQAAQKVRDQRAKEKAEGNQPKSRTTTWDATLFNQDSKDSTKIGAGYGSWKSSFDEVVSESLAPVTSEAHGDATMRILTELQAMRENAAQAQFEEKARWLDFNKRFVTVETRCSEMKSQLDKLAMAPGIPSPPNSPSSASTTGRTFRKTGVK